MPYAYPVPRIEYNKVVGKTRVENIANILEHLGFAVIIKEPENHDVDVWAYRDESLVLVIEVLNWRKRDYLDFTRTMAIIRNLTNSKYDNSRKLLVFSFLQNIRNRLSFFNGFNIDFLELGFQTQPYYTFYANSPLASCMRPNNLTTRILVSRKLQAYLEGTDLI